MVKMVNGPYVQMLSKPYLYGFAVPHNSGKSSSKCICKKEEPEMAGHKSEMSPAVSHFHCGVWPSCWQKGLPMLIWHQGDIIDSTYRFLEFSNIHPYLLKDNCPLVNKVKQARLICCTEKNKIILNPMGTGGFLCEFKMHIFHFEMEILRILARLILRVLKPQSLRTGAPVK